MTEASSSRVTITLGRSRQVVRRAGAVVDASCEQNVSSVGTKRSVRDRLGGSTDTSALHNGPVNNKRQRGEISISSRGSNGVDEMHIGRDDLRLRLMRKNASRQALNEERQSNMDLREKLAKTAHSSAKVLDTRRQMPVREESSYVGRMPPPRVISELPRAEPLRSSSYAYRSMDMDHVRQRSPERLVATSRGLSPPRNREDMQRVPALRASDDVRSIPYMRKDVLEPPRPATTNAVYMRNSAHPASNAGPPQPGRGQPPPPPPAAVVQRSSFMVNEHQTVDGLLQALGLGKYAIIFKAEEVDMTALKQMGESDLKEIGIPMGPRKKILLALAPRSKRHQ